MHTLTHTLGNNRGSVLAIGLLTLALLSLIGVSATTTSSIEVQIAGNDKAYKDAFYAAELGLTLGERVALAFASRVDLEEDSDSTDGRYAKNTQPSWKTLSWNDTDSEVVQAADLPARLQHMAPRIHYTLEERIFNRTGTLTVGHTQPTALYYFTVTSHAKGGDDSTAVVLQTIYARQFN